MRGLRGCLPATGGSHSKNVSEIAGSGEVTAASSGRIGYPRANPLAMNLVIRSAVLFLSLVALGASGLACKQGAGDRCEIQSDCESNLLCQSGICISETAVATGGAAAHENGTGGGGGGAEAGGGDDGSLAGAGGAAGFSSSQGGGAGQAGQGDGQAGGAGGAGGGSGNAGAGGEGGSAGTSDGGDGPVTPDASVTDAPVSEAIDAATAS